MSENVYGSRGRPVKISTARVLDAEALRATLGDLSGEAGAISGGHIVEVGSDESSGPFEIVTYPECVDGHVVIHTGHKDFGTGMSVEDGSVVTTMPCTLSADPTNRTAPEQRSEIVEGGFLASVPAELSDRVDVDGSLFVVVTTGDAGADSAKPISTTWDTASCENGHVVMHYGHEDPNTMTSVYDGSVSTSVPCSG
jgi:hypothetical protein